MADTRLFRSVIWRQTDRRGESVLIGHNTISLSSHEAQKESHLDQEVKRTVIRHVFDAKRGFQAPSPDSQTEGPLRQLQNPAFI